MEYVKVRGGRVVATKLPKNGQLKDGRLVSGYDRLPQEQLLNEGYLPVEEVKPILKEGEALGEPSYEILKDKVVKSYSETVKNQIGEIEPDETINELKKKVSELEKAVFHEK